MIQSWPRRLKFQRGDDYNFHQSDKNIFYQGENIPFIKEAEYIFQQDDYHQWDRRGEEGSVMYGESWSICSGRSCRLLLQYLHFSVFAVFAGSADCCCSQLSSGQRGEGDRRRGGGGRREMALIKGRERAGKRKGGSLERVKGKT